MKGDGWLPLEPFRVGSHVVKVPRAHGVLPDPGGRASKLQRLSGRAPERVPHPALLGCVRRLPSACRGVKDEERSRTSAQKIVDLIKKLAKYLPLHFSG